MNMIKPVKLKIATSISWLASLLVVLVFVFAIQEAPIRYFALVVGVLTMIGLPKFLKWALWGSYAMLCISTMLVVVLTMPDVPEPDFMLGLFGGFPPVEVQWLIVVSFSAVFLWSIHVLSTHKQHFYRKWW